MKPIRTSKGKMYGMFDEEKSLLHIRDGKDERIIYVPREGLKLMYIAGANQPETIFIPPKKVI
jgi:hypothetical protein